MARRPLEHVKIVDLSRLLPGGFCTLLLADLGADVLKVEEPGRGDYARWYPPFKGGFSATHIALNRGKRSMTLNLKAPAGVEVFKRLAAVADVVVESFRPGVMDRLGVGYEALREINPGLVFCAITGYGRDGPYRDRAGHDINYIGIAGVLGITGERDGPAVLPGVQIGDIGGGGLTAAVGILAALADRERTGEGRFVDVSMLDGVLSWMGVHASDYFVRGTVPERGRMILNGGLACYRTYRCADGKEIAVGALEPQFWEEFCTAVGVPEFAGREMAPEDEQERMAERIAQIIRTRPRDEWVRELAELDACVGPVNDLAEVFADPQVRARGIVGAVPTPEGPVPAVGGPIPMSPGRGGELAPPPGMGEHTDSVLAALGYSDAEVAALRAAGAV